MLKLLTSYLLLMLCFVVNGFAGNFSYLSDNNNKIACKFEDKTPGVEKGEFIIPNEYRTNQYGALLKTIQGDMMISVGSIRSFIIFGLSNFTYGVFADYDGGIVQFNKLLLDLMLALYDSGLPLSHQRFQFITLLSSGMELNEEKLQALNKSEKLESQKIRDIIGLVKDGKNSLKKPDINIMTILDRIYSLYTNQYEDSDKLSELSRFQGRIIFKYYYEEDERHKNTPDWSGSFYFNQDKVNANNRYFWESDEQWKRIVDAAKNNKIAVIARNIADHGFYEEIGSCLGKLHAKLGLLDFSNIIPGSTYLNLEGKNNIIAGVNRVSKTSSSLLFMTSHKTYSELSHLTEQFFLPGWHYYYLKLSNIALIDNLW